MTLSARALNRALLARQLLLEREDLAVPAALDRLGGLQAQYAPSMYVGLWSRLGSFRRGALTGALEAREVIQGTLMRVTIHVVAPQDYWPFALATREARRRIWLRAYKVDPTEMQAAADRLRPRLADGPLRRAEIEALVGKPHALGVGLWIDLVRVPPSGTWERRRADLYAVAEDWLGPPEITTEAAIEHLVRRYLAGFGPAARSDIASYTGLLQRELQPALEGLRTLRGESGDELLDVPGAPLPDPRTEAPVRFLAPWDATLLVHARRTGILPEVHRPRVFNTKTPHSVGTFLVGGAVAGAWRPAGGGIELEPFESLGAAAERAVREEADRLADFYR